MADQIDSMRKLLNEALDIINGLVGAEDAHCGDCEKCTLQKEASKFVLEVRPMIRGMANIVGLPGEFTDLAESDLAFKVLVKSVNLKKDFPIQIDLIKSRVDPPSRHMFSQRLQATNFIEEQIRRYENYMGKQVGT